ncbi:MAG: membrane protease subunit, stomatin/prohibitin [Bacteroidetes bacterium 4572_117]|nr:MAG: membrane protease subunit, stomatin/prohibitin [Bacteroidetes bacterium 4572_117]
MFGIKYIKFDSMTHVIHYKNGKIVKEGIGLSFFYTSFNSSIVAIPMGSNDLQFIFNESTGDFQKISIQGQITYKIKNPKQLAELLDFTVDADGDYNNEDDEKLKQRLINQAQTATSSFIQSLILKEAIVNAKNIEHKIQEGLQVSEAVLLLGVEVLAVNVIAVKPSPEMSKALETTTREALQQEADEAIYLRRNFAVEQERKIKESQLNTEIAVEEKKKQIAEKKNESQVLKAGNDRKLREMKVEADISVEEQNKNLIGLKIENQKKQADAEKYRLEATLLPYKEMDWKTLMAINPGGGNPKLNIALAFRELAENAQNINNLNITPNLLDSLIEDPEGQRQQR